MKQLIYRSQPFGFDRAMLDGILVGSRRKNSRDRITGALICRHDLYLQLIEGDDAAIDALYSRILRDDRHDNVRLLLSDTIDQRTFPEWAMLDDEMPSIAWSVAEVAAGAVDAATPVAMRDVFELNGGDGARAHGPITLPGKGPSRVAPSSGKATPRRSMGTGATFAEQAS